MDEKRLCPYCKNDTFLRTTKAKVKIFDDGETMRDEIDWEETEAYHCEKCYSEVTEEELIKS